MDSVFGLRILLTGPDGQVGWECRRSLHALGRVHAVGRDACDLARPEALRALVREASPDLIVNTDDTIFDSLGTAEDRVRMLWDLSARVWKSAKS